jgi:hypothetical protein
LVIYPYYALLQALVLPPLGALYYLWLWRKRRTLKPPGRYRIGFRRETLDLSRWHHVPEPRATALLAPAREPC